MRASSSTYIRAIEEMRSHGLVTNAELARKWGIAESLSRWYCCKGKIAKAFWNHEIRTWFYHADAEKPVATKKGRPRSVRIKRSWSMWPAPMAANKSSGWFGG